MEDNPIDKALNRDNISIILVRPRYPENIGAAARAMLNMGIKKLIVVSPENYDIERINKMATHFAAGVIRDAKIFDSVREATEPFSFVFGTTARLGKLRQAVYSPERMAEKLAEVTPENQAAIMFGSEDKGLTNDETRYCHYLVNIPTEEFSSLNLAQAVMVICYEIFKSGMNASKGFSPRLANRHELDAMYDQLKDVLVRISYINPQNPDHWIDKLRHFFTRFELRAKEVNIIRGICRQIDWYAGKCYKDGINDANKKENI